MITSMISPMITSMFGAGGGGSTPTFSPLTTSYTSADFTPIVVSNTEVISFHVQGLDTSTSIRRFTRGTTASIYYRGSDGRFRLTDDIGALRTLNYTGLNDGGNYYVEIRIDSGGWDLYVDDIYINRSSGAVGNLTLDSLANTMSVATLYGVTLGGSASWPMQSTSDDVFDGADMIGNNNLTYTGAPIPITSADTTETPPL